MDKSKEALVTLATGEKYQAFYNEHFRPSHERFAQKIGRKLIVIEDYIDDSEYGRSRHPAWQKLLIFKSPKIKEFDRLCWIDGDIFITGHSLDPFDKIGQNGWAAVRNNTYNSERLAKTDLNLYAYCPRDDRPEYILNTGFFIVNREEHAELMEYVYKNYDEQPCYENGPLSYHFLNTSPGTELDRSFNNLVPSYTAVKGRSLYSIYKLVEESNFIHFCGGIDEDILQKILNIDQQSKFMREIFKIVSKFVEVEKSLLRKILFKESPHLKNHVIEATKGPIKRILGPRLVATINTFLSFKNDMTSNSNAKPVPDPDTEIKRLTALSSLDKELKLHFGCGPRILKGWINIDLVYEPYHSYMQYYTDKYYPEEIRGDQNDFYAIDITKTGIPLPDESVDVIFHEDFIEHLNQRDTVIFLAETLRVLKKGGVHRVNTPNLLSSMRDHSNFKKGIQGVYAYEWDHIQHLNILTPDYLKELALMVGYQEIIFTGRDESTSKLIPLEYRPDPRDRPEDGNIFADLLK
jgi:predicted SAM-dependent methyltransferase